MTDLQPHGTLRPGGRTARTREAVLAAALEELGSTEFRQLTIDKLAQRSGVHAATIRRRWRTVDGVVCDLLTERSSFVRFPDTGDFRQDLHALAEANLEFFSTLRHRNLVERMVAAAPLDPRAEKLFRDCIDDSSQEANQLVHRAIGRGDLPPDTDPDAIITALVAPIYYRILINRRPLEADLARTSAEAVYHAVQAGAFGGS
ncbi:TetR-like C-terminal domain-containing protein [Streptomyces sp. NPDC048483]|uniref:TetR-like C-terminal domain-containing protein n=1 Tax=Streptomyces sp. NPDC048483 TaxID=3154927 RepID=UPI00343ABE88